MNLVDVLSDVGVLMLIVSVLLKASTNHTLLYRCLFQGVILPIDL